MLLLAFTVDGNLFGLDSSVIAEVTLVTRYDPIPLSSDRVTGVCRYRGGFIPVIDISNLLTGVPARNLFSTRLIVVQAAIGSKEPRSLGIIAERAIRTVRYSLDDLQEPVAGSNRAPYLGKIAVSNGSAFQILLLEPLIENQIGNAFFDSLANAD